MTNSDRPSCFSAGERRAILDYLRQLLAELTGIDSREPELPEIAALQETGSCFITLRTEGMLRGCIGNTAAFEPLGRNLKRNLLNAATADPVLPPLEAGEVEVTEIEVSILSRPEKAEDISAIVPGRDGVILRLGSRTAVFLPQIAASRRWNRERLLENLALKLGADADAWQSPEAEILTFRTEVFSN